MPGLAPAANTTRQSDESLVAARWAAGLRGPLRLEDGRRITVVFPGVPGGGAGPDFRGAVVEVGGEDLLRGDIEVHARASGWRAHGHSSDPAYAGVVLHVVGDNDGRTLATLHAGARAIPILVVAPETGHPPPFTPPCAITSRRTGGRDSVQDALTRLGRRRLRTKAARVQPAVESGPAAAPSSLAGLLIEQLGGANREAFATIARRLPLPALLERVPADAGVPGTGQRAAAIHSLLSDAAAGLPLRQAGMRPQAAPAARLKAAAGLLARLWPDGETPLWPVALERPPRPAALHSPGIGRATAIELITNAVLPAGLAGGRWSEAEALAALAALAAPATYGRLRRLEGWLGAPDRSPFSSALALQGGLSLASDYCSRGACGRCPLSADV